MYRPRRTSEFHEDGREEGSVLKKRQTRSQLRPTTTQQQLRLTQYSPACTGKRSLATGSRTSVTPMRHRQASSAERAVVQHKDKKWVQEQSQLIAEYLDEIMQQQPLQGFSNDFFSRGSAALKQMTMKQFVAIVNHFLQCSFGNRINVGANHVEDITNALHKLRYPYQVNKSWLVTPTTQASFGHVIVMLDFLKEFAPLSPAKQQQLHKTEFSFMETNEQPSYLQNTMDSMALASNLQVSRLIINEETNHLLFPSAAESFGVWDTQNWDEYTVLKRKVSKPIIKTLCDLPDSEALEADLNRQRNEQMQLDEQLQIPNDNNTSKELQQLRTQVQHMENELISMQNNTKEHKKKNEHLYACQSERIKRIKVMSKEQQQLQQQVHGQCCTTEKFQSMKIKLSDLSNEDQFYIRQIRDFTEHGNNQQVRLARVKKQLMDQVEKFNIHAQNIALDPDICSSREKKQLQLVLPLPPQRNDVVVSCQRLEKLATMLQQQKGQLKDRCLQLEQSKVELLLLNGQLEAQLNSLNTQIQSLEHQMQELPDNYASECCNLLKEQQQLIVNNCQLNEKVEVLQRQHEELAHLLHTKKQQNEDILSAAEQRQNKQLAAHDTFVTEHKQLLAQAEEKLKDVNENIAQNDIILNKFKSKLATLKLPPFMSELNL